MQNLNLDLKIIENISTKIIKTFKRKQKYSKENM